MNRRDCIKLLGVTFAGGLMSGCELFDSTPLTDKLPQEKKYTESFSTIYLSTDDKKLVVMTKKYHYIFDAPYALVVALKTELHSALVGRLHDMYVDGNNNQVKIAVELKVKSDATPMQKQLAMAAGFKAQDDSNKTLGVALDLKGTRYLSGGMVPPVNSMSLNQPYSIDVNVGLSHGQKAGRILLTPITLSADGALMIGQIALFALMLPVALMFRHSWDH